MPTIYEVLRADVISAMKAHNATATLSLRTADAAIQKASLDQGKPVDDVMVIATLRKSVKNLIDADVEFGKAGRVDLVAANEAEIKLLEKYLPKGLDQTKLEALVAEVIQETGAKSRKEMGKVIGALKKRPEAGLIDFGQASKLVQAKLP